MKKLAFALAALAAMPAAAQNIEALAARLPADVDGMVQVWDEAGEGEHSVIYAWPGRSTRDGLSVAVIVPGGQPVAGLDDPALRDSAQEAAMGIASESGGDVALTQVDFGGTPALCSHGAMQLDFGAGLEGRLVVNCHAAIGGAMVVVSNGAVDLPDPATPENEQAAEAAAMGHIATVFSALAQ